MLFLSNVQQMKRNTQCNIRILAQKAIIIHFIQIGESPGVDLDTLKRRAERFGQSNSTTMQKLELQEKIKERESRFGKVDTSTAQSKRPRIVSPNQNLVVDEKMKKRAERFGIKAQPSQYSSYDILLNLSNCCNNKILQVLRK